MIVRLSWPRGEPFPPLRFCTKCSAQRTEASVLSWGGYVHESGCVDDDPFSVWVRAEIRRMNERLWRLPTVSTEVGVVAA